MRLFRLLRQGCVRQAIAIAAEVGELGKCLVGGEVDVTKLGKTLQGALDLSVTLEIKELERSSVPELQKVHKRRRIKIHLEPFPARAEAGRPRWGGRLHRRGD